MKTCLYCTSEKSYEEFNKNKRNKDGLQDKCKMCQAAYRKVWYEAHKEEQKARVGLFKRDLRKKARDIVIAAKNVPCADCKQEYPWYVMDFDHLPEYVKVDDISQLVKSGASLKRLQLEIDKCEVVCSNCHRERTFCLRS